MSKWLVFGFFDVLRGMAFYTDRGFWKGLAGRFDSIQTVIDRYSRKVLAWELSNSMDVRLCVEALETALEKVRKA